MKKAGCRMMSYGIEHGEFIHEIKGFLPGKPDKRKNNLRTRARSHGKKNRASIG